MPGSANRAYERLFADLNLRGRKIDTRELRGREPLGEREQIQPFATAECQHAAAIRDDSVRMTINFVSNILKRPLEVIEIVHDERQVIDFVVIIG